MHRIRKLRTSDAGLVGGDGSALDTNVVLLAGLSSIESNLIVGGITVLHTKIEILDVKVQVGVDELQTRTNRHGDVSKGQAPVGELHSASKCIVPCP